MQPVKQKLKNNFYQLIKNKLQLNIQKLNYHFRQLFKEIQ